MLIFFSGSSWSKIYPEREVEGCDWMQTYFEIRSGQAAKWPSGEWLRFLENEAARQPDLTGEKTKC